MHGKDATAFLKRQLGRVVRAGLGPQCGHSTVTARSQHGHSTAHRPPSCAHRTDQRATSSGRNAIYLLLRHDGGSGR